MIAVACPVFMVKISSVSRVRPGPVLVIMVALSVWRASSVIEFLLLDMAS